jgi:hypothetical protein
LSRQSFIFGLIVVATVHSLLVMLWVMPANPFRDAVGEERLSGYINPYFEQSWSVFAPTPRRGGENVLIRAYVGDVKKLDGKLTPWFDITSDEDARTEYLVNPSRIHSATRRLGGNINSAMGGFNGVQRELVTANYIETPIDKLRDALNKAGNVGPAGDPNIKSYMENDRMLTRFATMYATARWGKGVTLVQFRVGHRTVPPYAQRNSVKLEDVPFTYFVFGLRKAMPGNHDAQTSFDSYVKRAPSSDRSKWVPIKSLEPQKDKE